MKAALSVAILLVASALIIWVRGGATFPIVQVLPFCGGHGPGCYDLASAIMLLIAIWGLWRLLRAREP
jgi:hypothetical protein